MLKFAIAGLVGIFPQLALGQQQSQSQAPVDQALKFSPVVITAGNPDDVDPFELPANPTLEVVSKKADLDKVNALYQALRYEIAAVQAKFDFEKVASEQDITKLRDLQKKADQLADLIESAQAEFSQEVDRSKADANTANLPAEKPKEKSGSPAVKVSH
jgi:hypothetical protein